MTDDIAIVGGGPAGAYLGYCLAQSGIYATVFDDSHPREKACGGGITPFALEKFPLLRAVPGSYRYVDRVLFVSPEGREALVSGQPLMNVSRERLDSYLLQKATDSGAKLIEERVVGIEETEDRWLIKTANGEYHAKLLVGADGANSVVRRTVLGRISREDVAACIGYYATGVERDYSVLQFFKDFKGYAWIFPRETHSSIGVGLDIKQAKQLPVYLNKFIEDYCPAIEKISPFGALVPAARSHKFYDLPCAGNNWILIGDAAGHVDPVLGEGIRYALWGAELAAGAILKGEPMMFDNQWRKAYGRDFIEACKLRDFIYDSKMLERGVTLISQSGTFAGIMMGVIAGTQSYRNLREKVIASLPQILSEIR
jgi:geranylgeranyl reductase family protein